MTSFTFVPFMLSTNCNKIYTILAWNVSVFFIQIAIFPRIERNISLPRVKYRTELYVFRLTPKLYGHWRATELQELHITYGYRKSYENQLAWLLVILLIAILNYLILSILLQGPKIGRAFERLEGDFSFHVYRFLYYSGILSNSNRLYQSHKIETNILRLRI